MSAADSLKAEAVARVDALEATGAIGAAAAAAREAGLHARAARLYASIWEFGDAAACALAAGDELGALDAALAAHDLVTAAPLVTRLAADPARAPAIAELCMRGGAPLLAAPVLERVGRHAEAAAAWERGGRPVDAARELSLAGREADAGRLLERVAASPDPGEAAPAHLALGRMLAARGRHTAAARHLQAAAGEASTAALALAALPRVLLAMGLRDAAGQALVRARALDPRLPESLGELERGALTKATPADAPLLAGRYRLGRLLGAGAAGRVHAAIDEVTGTEVAVKLFFAASARGREPYERFLREAMICGKLEHPNVVRVLDARQDLGFFVMELMRGGTLADKLTPRVPLPLVRRTALDVLAGLAAAHARGVVHRDLKPANIFYDERGTAKLGDFGVAHLMDLGQTQTGGLVGTLAYMAPEQITGAQLTFAADLYALGVTLFQAVTGRLPFIGPDFVAQHLGEIAPRASTVWPEAAPWDELIAALLVKDPAGRPASLDEVHRAVERLAPSGPAPTLVLGGAGARAPLARAPSATMPTSSEASQSMPAVPAAALHHETPLGDIGDDATLSRAIDPALERSVIVERWRADLGSGRVLRLRAFAAAGAPQLQRVLAFDAGERMAIYEAPVGGPLGMTAAKLGDDVAVGALAALAAALAPLHARGLGHGGVTADRVVIDDDEDVTLLVAGLGPLPSPAPAPADDIAAVLALIATAWQRPLAEWPGVTASIVTSPPTNAAALAALARSIADALASRRRLATHVIALMSAARTSRDPEAALAEVRKLAIARGADEALVMEQE